MNIEHEKEILNALVSGVNPFTGEIYDKNHILQNPEIVRVLFFALKVLKDVSKPPTNSGKPWTKEEDQRLIAAFDIGISVMHIAEVHCRTVGAITSRLSKLGYESNSPSNEYASLQNLDTNGKISDEEDIIEENDSSLESIYGILSSGSGESVYLSDGVWLTSGGRTYDRGR